MIDGRRRVTIENLAPQVEGGRFPAKRAVGETLNASADVFVDGHDILHAVLLHRLAGESEFVETAMVHVGNDRWAAEVPVIAKQDISYTVEAWVDHFASWLAGLHKKFAAGQDVSVDLLDGSRMVLATAERAEGAGQAGDAETLQIFSSGLTGNNPAQAVAKAADPLLSVLMNKHVDRTLASRYPNELRIQVEPQLAAASAWYELFPRSAAPAGGHGTFRDVISQLPRIADMGFDILYLPPIHPIGESYRKGKNNSPIAEPEDVGSPWAIGGKAGGHSAVHPDLGSMADFEALVAAAKGVGLEIALDIAFQCSPDHPWVTEHPEWFLIRANGSIQYAENPPKRYQDVYPFDFECADWRKLWEALRDIFLFWVGKGVRVFRVDNPHTKPLDFWQWCLAEVHQACPDSIFLAEAFTRPKVMYRLAKVGFTQSYTYFTWRNSKLELTEYVNELVRTAPRDFFRPNFWPNTPDILPEYLQYGGRPAHIVRLILAATLSSNYGLYGPTFNLCDSKAIEGTEDYADSEKYQIRDWDMDRPDSLEPFIKRINAIRRAHPALQQSWNIRFLQADNEFILFFVKYDNQASDLILTAVNLDPHNIQSAWLHLPLEDFGLDDQQTYMVHDLLGDDKFIWQGGRNFMEFDPRVLPARIFHLKKRLKSETDFDYFM